MTKLGPTAEELLPHIRKANEDYPYFDSSEAMRIARFATEVAGVKGAAAYREATPQDVSGVKGPFAGNPLRALETVIERANFLWRCDRDMRATAKGSGALPALQVRFCSFCPPKRAGKELVLDLKDLQRHPLLDCSLPRCNGLTYVATAKTVEQKGYDNLPSAI